MLGEVRQVVPEAALRDKLRFHTSARSVQRHAAMWIAADDGYVDRERLRALCKALRVYDTACFAHYMADVRLGLSVKWFRQSRGGWVLTAAGRREAKRFKA